MVWVQVEYARGQKEEEDKLMEELYQEMAQNEPVDPLTSLGGTITSDNIPFVELGLTPFTLSKKNMVA